MAIRRQTRYLEAAVYSQNVSISLETSASPLASRIAFLGASTIYGRVDPEGGGFVSRFRRVHESRNRQNAVFNLGISGDTVASMRERLVLECPPRTPDLIIVSTGANDTRRIGSQNASHQTSLLDFETAIAGIIEEAKAIAPLAFFGVFPINDTLTQPLRGTDFFYQNSDVEIYANITQEHCSRHHIPYWNTFEKWHTQDYLPWLAKDGLHCNSLGHQELAEEVDIFIRDIARGQF